MSTYCLCSSVSQFKINCSDRFFYCTTTWSSKTCPLDCKEVLAQKSLSVCVFVCWGQRNIENRCSRKKHFLTFFDVESSNPSIIPSELLCERSCDKNPLSRSKKYQRTLSDLVEPLVEVSRVQGFVENCFVRRMMYDFGYPSSILL